MRKLLWGVVALIGAGVAGSAQARPPVAWVPVYIGAPVATPVQYYEDWRGREWRRHEEHERWRRHEERRRWFEHRREREWHRGW